MPSGSRAGERAHALIRAPAGADPIDAARDAQLVDGADDQRVGWRLRRRGARASIAAIRRTSAARFAAVLGVALRRVGDHDGIGARRGFDRGAEVNPRAEALDRRRLLDVERLALRDAPCSSISRTSLTRPRAASLCASAPPRAPAPRIAMKDIGVDYSTEMNTGSPTGAGSLEGKVALVTGGSRASASRLRAALVDRALRS